MRSILEITDKSPGLISYVKDRLGHDFRYAIDSSKVKEAFGWEPKTSFEDGLKKTIKWYENNSAWVEAVKSRS